jgi:hypothetical protein
VYFALVIFGDGGLLNYLLGWPGTLILLMLASQRTNYRHEPLAPGNMNILVHISWCTKACTAIALFARSGISVLFSTV